MIYRFLLLNIISLIFIIGIHSSVWADDKKRQWQPLEITFTSAANYENPLNFYEIEFKVIFTAPSGNQYSTLGFFNDIGIYPTNITII